MDFSVEFFTLLTALTGTIISWLMTDAKTKGRLIFIEERFNQAQEAHAKLAHAFNNKVAIYEVKIAKSEQDREAIHTLFNRLETSKASKEVVDGFRFELQTLRVDMDRRFDRIERLLEDSLGSNGNR